MLKLALKNIGAHKVRLLLTALAVILGVTFVVASFVVTDSLRSTFNTLSANVNTGNDLVVRQKVDFGERRDNVRVPGTLEAQVKALPGVGEAEGQIFVDNGAVPVDAQGKVVTTKGAPVAGASWGDSPSLTRWVLRSGAKPNGPDQFAIDKDTAQKHHFEVGKRYDLITLAGRRSFTLTGINTFTDKSNASVGAVFVTFDDKTAQDVLGMPGEYQEIWIHLAPGANRDQVQAAVQKLVPANVEVITNQVAAKDFADSFNKFIGPFGTILLVFALIIAFVSAFLINNTFNIVLGQRIRELGLLRAVGASGQQVKRSVQLEALAVGVFSTVAGLGLGVLGALGIRALFSSLGLSLPAGPILLKPRTIIAAVIVGVGVTMLSALLPARKAAKVPPIAALRDDARLSTGGARRRSAIGAAFTVVGLVLAGLGLFGGIGSVPTKLLTLGGGAVLIFIGVAVLSPIVARPVSYALGAPIRRSLGTAGRLAQENAARNPRRTAATASALMIGLALVCMVSVMGASLKSSFASTLKDNVTADFIVRPSGNNNGDAGFTPQVAKDLAALPDVSAVSSIRQGQFQINGDTKAMNAVDLSTFDQLFQVNVSSGSLKNLGGNDLVIHKDAAKKLRVKVGDTVPVRFQNGDAQPFTVRAIFNDNKIFANYLIDLSAWDKNIPKQADVFAAAKLKPGAPVDHARAAIEQALQPYPQLKVEDKVQFRQSQEQQINNVFIIINVFLFIAVVIALIGIVNTLTLSVFERIRELGLLRAVGMTRRQMKRMIRWEAVVIAVFGALLGAVMGILFGIALAQAVPSSIISTTTIPFGSIILFIVLAGVFGLVAASLPARRASRLNVLDAIAQQ